MSAPVQSSAPEDFPSGRFETFSSKVVVISAENVDTDQIVPARFLKMTDKAGLADILFNDWRYAPDGSPRVDFPLNDPANAGRRILLAGVNFGSGSSREHAPWALRAWGFRAVLAPSFADIFRANALKNGLLPIECDAGRLAGLMSEAALDPELTLTVDLAASLVHLPGDEDLPFVVDGFARSMLLAGTDELGYLLGKAPAITAYEANHQARFDARR
jgi:3-isopropylmalate/(R)-2-methylmalate dehydratase small subunit